MVNWIYYYYSIHMGDYILIRSMGASGYRVIFAKLRICQWVRQSFSAAVY